MSGHEPAEVTCVVGDLMSEAVGPVPPVRARLGAVLETVLLEKRYVSVFTNCQSKKKKLSYLVPVLVDWAVVDRGVVEVVRVGVDVVLGDLLFGLQ